MKLGNKSKLVICVLACLAIGMLGTVFTAPAITGWYAALQKPPFNPPNWLFAPVWTALYALMGVSLYLVVKNGLTERKVRIGASIFAVQLALNVLWSFLFFGLRQPFYGVINIVALWFAILATIIWFRKIDRRAAYLLVPYLLWVSFATVLNLYIWVLN